MGSAGEGADRRDQGDRMTARDWISLAAWVALVPIMCWGW